jgi:ABC-type multidrug transport system fused ATPase/permease subunit
VRLVRRLLELHIDFAASIDFKTDTKIQAAVREEFKNACLLTIAHRIRTVIDYDRLVNTESPSSLSYSDSNCSLS